MKDFRPTRELDRMKYIKCARRGCRPKLPMTLISLVILVAAVGSCTATPDIMSKWRSYGGDMALAASASVMVFCSCDVIGGICNVTMAAQIQLKDEPECYTICGDRMECAYCRYPVCACSPTSVSSYRLCLSGNRADLYQCSNHACATTRDMACTCDIVITRQDTNVRSPSTVQPPQPTVQPPNTPVTGDTAFNHGLLTGLAVGGIFLLFLIIFLIILVACGFFRRRTTDLPTASRMNTSSPSTPPPPQTGLKGMNNPTYEHGHAIHPSRPTPAPQFNNTSYLYPYAPRLTANRHPHASSRDSSRPTSANASSQPSSHHHHYQEITPRERDQPPTYEDSEGYTRYRAQVDGDAGRERRQPVYMELVRPSDRTFRPPIDTFMY